MDGHGEKGRLCRLDLTMFAGPSVEEIDAVSARYPSAGDEMSRELMDAIDELGGPLESASYFAILSPFQALAVRELLEELGVRLLPDTPS